MQQTIGLKRFVVSHVGPIVAGGGVFVVVVLGLAGLGATGNLPWTADSSSSSAVSQSAVVATAPEGRTATVERMHRFYQHKETRLEANELARSTLADRADRIDALRRYVEYKERSLDTRH